MDAKAPPTPPPSSLSHPSQANYGATAPTASSPPPPIRRHSTISHTAEYSRSRSDPSAMTRHASTVSEPATTFRGQVTQMRDGVSIGLEGYSSHLNILLIFVPVAILAYFFRWGDVIIFTASFLGMVPLAMLLGKATEDIAEHTNETLGALVNVTFGNAVELILSISALRANKLQLIQDTIAGSILSNLLLVLGSAFFFGGLMHHEQVVLPMVSEANADLLSFAVFGLTVPALYVTAVPAERRAPEGEQLVSLGTAIALLLIYAMYLLFQMYTHADLYDDATVRARAADPGGSMDPASARNMTPYGREEMGFRPDLYDVNDSAPLMAPTGVRPEPVPVVREPEPQEDDDDDENQIASLPVAVAILVWMVAWVALLSNLLVNSIDNFSAAVGLREKFIAVVLLPVVGNAVEHMSAILVARHNKIDLSIGIACGSSVQIALFAAPVLVVISWIFGENHLTLNFQLFETICIGFSVFVVNATLRDSRTNWLEGAVLIMCYFILATAFFYMA